jgi:hypothetical protein
VTVAIARIPNTQGRPICFEQAANGREESPLLAFSRKNLTIHLEDREARALVMAGSGVARWASLSIPPGVINGGVVADPKLLAEVLRELLKQVQAGRRPLVSLSGLHPVVRMLNLPPIKRDLIAEAIQGEMRRELPSPIEYYQISWIPVEVSKTETKLYVLAVPSSELESYMAAFKQARISPRSVTLEALAVASALDPGDAIIIGIKDTGFSIVVIRMGIPVIMRDSTYPQENLSMADLVADLGRELRLTLASFGPDTPADPIAFPLSIYLLGKNTKDDYLTNYLSQEIGFQLSSFQPPAFYPESFPAVEYAANLGLALRRRKQGQPQALKASFAINLVPERYRQRPVPLPQAALLVAVVVGVVGVISPLSDVLQPDAESSRLRSDIARYQRGIDDARERLRTAREAEASRAQEMVLAEQLETGLQQIAGRHLIWPGVIEDSLATFPAVEILTFSESLTKLSILARAPTSAEAVAYATYLKNIGLFNDVNITSLSSEAQGQSSTGMQFNLIASRGG